MKHETIHELLALRLYGELAPDEARRVEQHLGECAACADFARELETTLGAVRATDEASQQRAELPSDWTARLEQATRSLSRRPRRLATLAGFAAGLAAGLLLMAGLRPPVPDAPGTAAEPARAGVVVASNGGGEPLPFTTRSTPPPRATTRGSMAQRASYLAR